MVRLPDLSLFGWAMGLWGRIVKSLGRTSVPDLPSEEEAEGAPTPLPPTINPDPTPIPALDSSPNPVLILKREDTPMIDFSMIQRHLQNFVSGTPEVQGAAVVSPDGLSLATALPAGYDEERTAAMSASILSLGESIATQLGRGAIARIVLEGDLGYSILVGCGDEGVLLVLASQNAKQGVLFLEVKRLVSEITPLLV